MTSDRSARDAVLARVRTGLGRDAGNLAAARDRVTAALGAPEPGPRPPPAGDLAARFRAEAERMSSTFDEVATSVDAPAAVARYLAAARLGPRVVAWPALGGIDWAGAGVEAEACAAGGADLVGITGCFCAIAETGTLMTCSGPGSPATNSLLPETHIALVPASRLVADMEAAWTLARRELGELPRAVNFISGPSRTGDIEMTIVLGAHGPYRVHLILLREE